MRFARIQLIHLATPKEAWSKYRAAMSRTIYWERENERSGPWRFWQSAYANARTTRELEAANLEAYAWMWAMDRALEIGS